VASVRLFVYGSLKRGGLHHEELKGATFLGRAVTEPGFGLVTQGDYLALVAQAPAGSAARVTGELFEVPLALLPGLDEFEGPNYERAELRVALEARAEAAGGAAAQSGSALAYFKKAR
jgi:gamma-glutamylaminecyclotransferase